MNISVTDTGKTGYNGNLCFAEEVVVIVVVFVLWVFIYPVIFKKSIWYVFARSFAYIGLLHVVLVYLVIIALPICVLEHEPFSMVQFT